MESRSDLTNLILPRKSLFFKDKFDNHFIHGNDDRNLLSYDSNELSNAFLKQWNRSQEESLSQSVTNMEHVQWSEVSNEMGRSERSCFSRYCNVINPSINKDPWDSAEEKLLLELTRKFGLHSWSEISKELGTGRTPFECLRHYQQALNNDIVNQGNWTEEEDVKLRDAILQHGMNWQLISRQFPNRSSQQCMNRWRKSPYCQESIISGHWQPHEERKLFLAAIAYDIPSLTASKRPFSDLETDANEVEVDRRSLVDWRAISRIIPGKSEVQCREKWCNNLDPFINHAVFSEEEDAQLTALVTRFGEVSWARIASYMPGRSDGAVRRRWKELHPDPVNVVSKKKVLPSKHGRTKVAHMKATDFKSELGFDLPDNLKT